MPQLQRSALLPHSANDMFDLVLDVARRYVSAMCLNGISRSWASRVVWYPYGLCWLWWTRRVSSPCGCRLRPLYAMPCEPRSDGEWPLAT